MKIRIAFLLLGLSSACICSALLAATPPVADANPINIAPAADQTSVTPTPAAIVAPPPEAATPILAPGLGAGVGSNLGSGFGAGPVGFILNPMQVVGADGNILTAFIAKKTNTAVVAATTVTR